MQDFLREGFLAICLMLVFSSLVGAFEVSSVSIEPKGLLDESCERVSGSFTITSFSTDAGDDYLSEGEYFTALDRPNWSLGLYRESIHPQHRKNMPKPTICCMPTRDFLQQTRENSS